MSGLHQPAPRSGRRDVVNLVYLDHNTLRQAVPVRLSATASIQHYPATAPPFSRDIPAGHHPSGGGRQRQHPTTNQRPSGFHDALAYPRLSSALPNHSENVVYQSRRPILPSGQHPRAVPPSGPVFQEPPAILGGYLGSAIPPIPLSYTPQGSPYSVPRAMGVASFAQSDQVLHRQPVPPDITSTAHCHFVQRAHLSQPGRPFPSPHHPNALQGQRVVSFEPLPTLPSTKEIPVLAGSSDFPLWFEKARAELQNQGVWAHVKAVGDVDEGDWIPGDDAIVMPPPLTRYASQHDIEYARRWAARDGVARHIIVSRLSPEVLVGIPKNEEGREARDASARTIWEFLLRVYGGGSLMRAMEQWQSVLVMKVGENGVTVGMLLKAYREAYYRMVMAKEVPRVIVVVQGLARALPREGVWAQLVVEYTARVDRRELDGLTAASVFCDIESLLEYDDPFCSEETDSSSPAESSGLDEEDSEVADSGDTAVGHSESMYFAGAAVDNLPDGFDKLLDSGCSRHIFADRELFWDYEETEVLEMGTANCGSLKTVGKGTIRLLLRPPGERPIALTLTDCRHAPTSRFNLLSVGSLQAKGVGVNFGSGGTLIGFESIGRTFEASRYDTLSFVEAEIIRPSATGRIVSSGCLALPQVVRGVQAELRAVGSPIDMQA